MIKITSLKDIEQLIKDGVEEGLTLDYKRDIGKGIDVACDITAFANTVGGILIYGVAEKNRKPVEITGVARNGIEETIRNIIRDSIQPTMTDIDITNGRFR